MAIDFKMIEWVLFDADETLFSFDAHAGLRHVYAQYGIEFSDQDYAHYQQTNLPLWQAYQDGKIDAQTLQVNRFQSWGDKLNVSPHQLNQAFLDAMAEVCIPLPYVADLLHTLAPHLRLGIITNGFTQLQQPRLARHNMQQHFDLLVVSDQVGAAKPSPKIFKYALDKMGGVPPERVLMVGDNPIADVQGGQQAGMQTCWYNPYQKVLPEGITPNLEVTCYSQLLACFSAARSTG